MLLRTLALALLLPSGCALAADAPRAPRSSPETPSIRPVRVLIAARLDRLRLRADGGLVVAPAAGGSAALPSEEWLELRLGPDGTVFLGDVAVASRTILVRPAAASTLWLATPQLEEWEPAVEYPGAMRLAVTDSGVDVVNEVELERYVACVVAGEVWPTFAAEAFRAQAIITRSFCLYQMLRRRGAAWDIGATQGAQVYRGVRSDETGRRAAVAAEYTRGIACTWNNGFEDQLFSTYYSAACGGVSQSAAIFGEADNVPPLAGGVRCDYCRIAPGDTYRWGPVYLPRQEVLARLAARFPEVAALSRGDNTGGGSAARPAPAREGEPARDTTDAAPDRARPGPSPAAASRAAATLTAVQIVERSPGGRATRLRLTGSNGKSVELLAEQFRLGIGGAVVRSTDCEIRMAGDEVIFESGRGFGHGLGLCQWGMQGQALAGRKAGEILRYYYPGCKLTRVY
ncbi:MAG: hypothetical protein HY763_09525 [Planctomycetes bacterium]|nr:hypothetical protein [Planctomycetota bacterium]